MVAFAFYRNIIAYSLTRDMTQREEMKGVARRDVTYLRQAAHTFCSVAESSACHNLLSGTSGQRMINQSGGRQRQGRVEGSAARRAGDGWHSGARAWRHQNRVAGVTLVGGIGGNRLPIFSS